MNYKLLIPVLIVMLSLVACSEPEATPTPEPSPTAVSITIPPTPTHTAVPTQEPTVTAVPPTPEPTTAVESPITDNGSPITDNGLPITGDDEGGPVAITGLVTYTNPFFTLGVAAPVVILEDQAGFVDRDKNYIFPVESQTLGQITSDFYTSPFSYSIALPIEPQGAWRDVDFDDE